MKNDVDTENDTILVGINEACKITGIGRNTMYKMVKMKGFPALIFPHKILIDKNQLPNWIAKNYGTYKN